MKVRALRPFLGPRGMVNQGDVIAVTEQYARDLEARRPQLAVRVIDQTNVDLLKASRAAKIDAGVAVQSIERPTETPPNGGPTGAETPASLSPPDQAQPTRRSRRRKAKPA